MVFASITRLARRWAPRAAATLGLITLGALAQESPGATDPSGNADRLLHLSPLRLRLDAGVLFLGFATDASAGDVTLEYSQDLLRWSEAVAVSSTIWDKNTPPPPPPIDWVESLGGDPGQNVRLVPLDIPAVGAGFYRVTLKPGQAGESGETASAKTVPGPSLL